MAAEIVRFVAGADDDGDGGQWTIDGGRLRSWGHLLDGVAGQFSKNENPEKQLHRRGGHEAVEQNGFKHGEAVRLGLVTGKGRECAPMATGAWDRRKRFSHYNLKKSLPLLQ